MKKRNLFIITLGLMTLSTLASAGTLSCQSLFQKKASSSSSSIFTKISQELQRGSDLKPGLFDKFIFSRNAITKKIDLTDGELRSLLSDPKALSLIDGLEVVTDRNIEGLKVTNVKQTTNRIPVMEVFNRFYDTQDGTAFRLTTINFSEVEAFLKRPTDIETAAVRRLRVSAYRIDNPLRDRFEKLPVVSNLQSLRENDVVQVKFYDTFNYELNRSEPSLRSEVIASYEDGRVFQHGNEPWIILDSGKVLRLNANVFEVRRPQDKDLDYPVADLETLFLRAYDSYGSTWGHNKRLQQFEHPSFAPGVGPSLEFVTSMKDWAKNRNPYLLSGLVVLYKDIQSNKIKMATYGIHEMPGDFFTAKGLLLPQIGEVPYTSIIGLVGSAGNAWQRFYKSLNKLSSSSK
ncbi:MAG: hypothetical protein BroJett040_20850 [Oligoflexia bacterium]|nr:MAG: hypothetical protein BroJett040_20850 [Oligoflexia bacterium]